jgi:hypothetical protein
VFRTEVLTTFIGLDLTRRAQDAVAAVPRDLLARTAAFVLLKDSRSSYAIKGERPPQDRIQRWGRAIGEAGRQPLDREELLRLQRIVLGDARSQGWAASPGTIRACSTHRRKGRRSDSGRPPRLRRIEERARNRR